MEDIIARGVGEMRKSAFGDDAEDAKDLPWTRAQAWSLMERLAKEEEVSGLSDGFPPPFHPQLKPTDSIPRHVDELPIQRGRDSTEEYGTCRIDNDHHAQWPAVDDSTGKTGAQVRV